MLNGKGRNISDADLTATAATCVGTENKVRAMSSEIEEFLQEFFEKFDKNQFAFLRNGGILVGKIKQKNKKGEGKDEKDCEYDVTRGGRLGACWSVGTLQTIHPGGFYGRSETRTALGIGQGLHFECKGQYIRVAFQLCKKFL
ncbi:MAG: hypothetical protein IKO93_18650 [Lentisphaeria bacterium]|nr:hypothetical protein [Lentisphaeria bacterium]